MGMLQKFQKIIQTLEFSSKKLESGTYRFSCHWILRLKVLFVEYKMAPVSILALIAKLLEKILKLAKRLALLELCQILLLIMKDSRWIRQKEKMLNNTLT